MCGGAGLPGHCLVGYAAAGFVGNMVTVAVAAMTIARVSLSHDGRQKTQNNHKLHFEIDIC